MQYDGIPLSNLKLPDSRWTFSQRYLEMAAAKAWGIVPPSQFYAYSRFDQAVIVATFLDERKMAAYDAEVQRHAAEAQTRNLGGRNRPRGGRA